MSWLFLFLAGVLEMVWAVGLKHSDGLSRWWPSVVTVTALAGSMILLALAVRTLPLGTAYAVWTGIGAAGSVVAGIVLFGEPAGAGRLGCVALILAGVIGLRLVEGPGDAAPADAAPAAGRR